MSEWWYADRGARIGPVEKEELASLYQTRNIDLNTVVWKKGMDEWLPLGNVEDLEELKESPPPPVEESENAAPAHARIATPWSRFCARMVDCIWETLIVALPLAFATTLVWPDARAILSHPVTAYMFALCCLPVGLCLDAAIYNKLGNTPGKALLRIRAAWRDESAIDFWDYLKRNFALWRRALYFGIFPVNVISMAIQYRHLNNGEQASYDASNQYRVRNIATADGE